MEEDYGQVAVIWQIHSPPGQIYPQDQKAGSVSHIRVIERIFGEKVIINGDEQNGI